MRSRFAHPYLVLATVALFWGGNAVAGKLAAGHVSPMLIVLIRWTFATLLIAPFAWPHVRRDRLVIRRHLPTLFLLGAAGFACFNAIFYLAVTYTTAINVTIEQSAMPLIVFVANFILFRTAVMPLQIVGFLLTLVGVLLTAGHGDLGSLLRLDLNRGDALMMIAVVLYGGYTVGLRFKPAIDWRAMLFVLSASALVVAIAFAIAEWWLGYSQLPDWQGFTASLYTAVFPGLLAQALYIKGVEMIGPNRANLFINLVPIFGAVLAVAIVGEQFHLYHLLALACVLGGITLAEKSARGKA
ncbi:DMT family transporter [Jiella sp. M17.18]|uniref:DMT family transporter n=1 Tax=Jiella sp. M17.18 TaxID=3234247 RepID=UPI0034DDE6B4